MFYKLKKYINDWNAEREFRKIAPALNKDAEGLNATELIELIYGDKWKRFFWIKQIRYEIESLCKIIEKKEPKVILEIGTETGGSLFLISKIVPDNATIISLDLPGGNFGGGYPEYKTAFYSTFKKKNQTLELIRGNSHHQESLNSVKQILNGRKIDFLFIDGDHTYDGVKKDVELYTPLVADDGFIALHDIAKHPVSWNVEVDKCWNEIKNNYRYEEYIENVNQGWAGIGLLYKS